MSLDLVLLGLLGRPASGYDLGRELAGRGAAWWPARRSQIYPTLARLEQRGWVVSGRQRSPKGPPRRVYGRTPEGTRALAEALASEPLPAHERRSWLAAARILGEPGDPALARDLLVALHGELSGQLATLDEQLEQLPPIDQPASSLDGHFLRASLRGARTSAAARLAWCAETLAGLEDAPWDEG